MVEPVPILAAVTVVVASAISGVPVAIVWVPPTAVVPPSIKLPDVNNIILEVASLGDTKTVRPIVEHPEISTVTQK